MKIAKQGISFESESFMDGCSHMVWVRPNIARSFRNDMVKQLNKKECERQAFYLCKDQERRNFQVSSGLFS
jgi:hypothetical protein